MQHLGKLNLHCWTMTACAGFAILPTNFIDVATNSVASSAAQCAEWKKWKKTAEDGNRGANNLACALIYIYMYKVG